MTANASNQYQLAGGPGTAEDRIARELARSIELDLIRLGLLGRVFARTKNRQSILTKLQSKREAYVAAGKKMQDLFGVRVAVYFSDDSEVAQQVVRSKFVLDSKSVDAPSQSIFGPTRCNLVFRLPEDLAQQSNLIRKEPLIDSTFEVQFRTVLSEGWHEVEHDLRYKRQAEWSRHPDLDRALNGVMATLESCDWSMLKIFEELAWRHYKSGELAGLIQAKFRLRLQGDGKLSDSTVALLRECPDVVKGIFRVDRAALLEAMIRFDIDVPLTAQNVVFICNRLFVHHPGLSELEPSPITQLLDRYQAQLRGDK